MTTKTGPRNAQDRYNDKRRQMKEFREKCAIEGWFTLGERPTTQGLAGGQEATIWQEHLHTSRLMLRELKQLDAQPGETYVSVDRRAWVAMQAAFQKAHPDFSDRVGFLLLNRNGKIVSECSTIRAVTAEKELWYYTKDAATDLEVGGEPGWECRPLTKDDIPSIPGAITLDSPSSAKPKPSSTLAQYTYLHCATCSQTSDTMTVDEAKRYDKSPFVCHNCRAKKARLAEAGKQNAREPHVLDSWGRPKFTEEQ
jgi:uncharacterized protein YceK